MTTCSKCPAWSYSHTLELPDNKEARIGYCRFEPPKVFRIDADNHTSLWPPTREDHWCIRGRVMMEATGQVRKSYLTMGPGE